MKIKHLRLLLLVLALGPGVALAANDVTLTTDVTNILVNGMTFTVARTGTVNDLTVGATTFSATLAPGASLKVTNSSKKILSIPVTNATQTETCDTASTYLISLASTASAAETVTMTPINASCPSSSPSSTGSSGGGGGGVGSVSVGSSSGGGGGSSSGSASVSTASSNVTKSNSASALAAATPSAPLKVSVPGGNQGIGAIVRAIVSPVFSVQLNVGQKSPDVLRLQKLLNSDPDTSISLSGAGSPGKETNLYGPATRKAIEKFQLKYKIAKKGDQGFGNFGPKTRAKFGEVFGTSQQSPVTNNQKSVASPQPHAPSLDAKAATRLQLDLLLKQLELMKAQKGSR